MNSTTERRLKVIVVELEIQSGKQTEVFNLHKKTAKVFRDGNSLPKGDDEILRC